MSQFELKISKDVIRVVTAHTAAPNSDELSINCGDRLHLVEIEEKRPKWSLVRRISDDAQGWVPSSCLRTPSVSSISAPSINDSSKRGIFPFRKFL
ncbi:SH3 domain-containing protein [Trichonephila clavata]|uniref:SH3 domain-containing protein n=1 Tax=Trichonephila clavata TaxID=2740835 RepID=A0A8X6JGC3_TRICU|nr:SH3 domain-containing protein [Trichonephila clavata]